MHVEWERKEAGKERRNNRGEEEGQIVKKKERKKKDGCKEGRIKGGEGRKEEEAKKLRDKIKEELLFSFPSFKCFHVFFTLTLLIRSSIICKNVIVLKGFLHMAAIVLIAWRRHCRLRHDFLSLYYFPLLVLVSKMVPYSLLRANRGHSLLTRVQWLDTSLCGISQAHCVVSTVPLRDKNTKTLKILYYKVNRVWFRTRRRSSFSLFLPLSLPSDHLTHFCLLPFLFFTLS